MELILVRHGITQGNLERRFIGVTDQPLTPEGEALAARRAEVIPAVEHVFVSPLRRCLRTAEILWPQTERTVLPELRETDFGRFECKCHEDLADDPDYLAWLDTGGTKDLLGTETLEQCVSRVEKALRIIVEACKVKKLNRVGVATHGGTIMNILWKFGRPERGYYDWMTPNCGGWIVSVSESDLTLQVLGPLEDLSP
ncbi:MAG: histidine phosphatase family protein [Oscillospiraceae bacterium]